MSFGQPSLLAPRWLGEHARHSTVARVAVALGACLMLVVATPAAAQQEAPSQERDEDELFEVPDNEEEQSSVDERGERRVRRLDQRPLSQMSREEAQAAGFVFGDDAEESTRTSATFLAATAGVFAHGVGHWYLDEKRTAGILLAIEGVSLGLVASALLWDGLSDGSPAARAYAGPALYAGAGLFGLSYLLDVIGTLHNADIGVPGNSRRSRGISMGAEYTYLNIEGYGAQTLQMLTAGSRVDLGWGYLGVRTDQDIYLDASVYGASLGARLWRGPANHTFLFVEADGELFSYDGVGAFRRLGAQGRVGLSLGLGGWISQLRNVAVGMSAGFGRHWYALAVDDTPRLEPGLDKSYVPLEMFLHFNLTERLNARVSYEHRDGTLLETTPAGVGVGSLEFIYASADMLDLVLRAEAGGGVGFTGGLRVWLWE